MESPWPENIWIDRKKASENLIQGRDSVNQLQILLQKSHGDGWLVSAEDLAEKIRQSIDGALSILNSGEIGGIRQSPAITGVSSPCSDDRKTEDSGESRKFPASKDQRGGYKRRKTSQTWTRLTPTPIDDGYAWRKYGQKEILNAKFPRSYFRCTHRNDQGCDATKQVQRTEDESSMYRTTYMGHHTCRDTLKAPQFVLDSSPRNPYVLDFQSSKQESFTPFSSFQSMNQKCKEEIPCDLTYHDQSSSEYLFLPDLTTFDSSGPTMLALTPGSDTTSSQSLEVGLMVESVDFDDVFHFDEEVFFN